MTWLLPLRLVAATIVVAVGLATTAALIAVGSLRSGYDAAASGTAAASAGSLPTAETAYGDAAMQFRRAHRALVPLDVTLGHLPLVARDVRLARAEARAAHASAAAAELLARLAQSLHERRRPLDVSAIAARRTHLAASADRLATALAALARRHPSASAPARLVEARRLLLRRGAHVLTALRGLVAVARIAAPGRTHLLVIQNPAELRATGGLVGAWGLVTSDDGALRVREIAADTALPRPRRAAAAEPEFRDRYGRHGATRDWATANMSPDFPTSARVLLGLYRSATGRSLDGVVSLDAVALAELAGAVGPLSVFGRRVTEETFLETVLSRAYSEHDRSDALLAAARAGLGRLGEAGDPLAVARALGSARNGGHLRAFAVAADAQTDLAAAGLDGAVARPRGDYLLVVAQNAGGNKLDYYLHTRLSATVRIERDGDARSRVDVRLANRAPRTGLAPYVVGLGERGKAPGYNHTYVSLYASSGAAMTSFASGASRTAESAYELGRPVFSWFETLAPGAARTSTLTLETPGAARRRGEIWTYTLLVQAQPRLHPPTLHLDVVLPEGSEIRSTTGGAAEAEGGRASFRLRADRDRSLSISYCICRSIGGN